LSDALFIELVGGCVSLREPAVPVVDVCACAPGVGPEPASLLAVVQGPANAVPLRSIAVQPAKRMCLTFIGKLLVLKVEDNPGDYERFLSSHCSMAFSSYQMAETREPGSGLKA
jgi:hypothetical protein